MVSKQRLIGKQKRFLRALGTGIDPVVHIGKGGVTDNVLYQIDEALEARELIKVKVLQNYGDDPKNVARELAEATDAEMVQVVGRNFLLYRRSMQRSVIELP